MKKLLLVSLLGIFILGLIACGGGDAKSVLRDYINSMKSFSEDMNSADSAGEVTKALNDFSDNMESIIPKMKTLSDKYPELKKMSSKGNLPEEFKEFETEMQEVATKMMGAFMKMGKYASDPKVAEANKRFMKTMQGLK